MLVIVQIIKEGGQEDGECKVMVSDSVDQGFLPLELAVFVRKTITFALQNTKINWRLHMINKFPSFRLSFAVKDHGE